MDEIVPGHGRGRGETSAGPGGGEPLAEATGGRPQYGQTDAVGGAAKKALKPAQLRPRADYLEVGEESPTSTLDQQRFMAERLPDLRLVVYPDLGHLIDAIHPEDTPNRYGSLSLR